MRKNLRKIPFILTAGASLLLSLFFSCKNEFITAPTPLQGSSLSRNASPQNLSASNGREKIYLSWQELTGASRYYIYATDASTPREEDFIQITQTTATSIELDVNPGSTVWYKVSAVDSSFTESKRSLAVRGSTLARPEITAIENSEDKITGEISVELDWFMSNCNKNTYLSSLEYDIKFIPEGGTEQIQTYRASDLELTHVVLENLDPHTKYTFQIVARNSLYGDTRESLALNQETLHRLRPAAPENLSATHGSDKDKVILSFTLPEGADVMKKSDGSYQQVPLKFEVYRKEHTAESWPSIPIKTITPANYKRGNEIQWNDNTSGLISGVIYDYKVKSVADIPNYINSSEYTFMETSENSAAVATGWKMKDPALYIKDYTPILADDGQSFAYATMGLNFVWDNFHEDSVELENMAKEKYKFLLYYMKKGFNDGASYSDPAFIQEFNSVSSLNQYAKTFTLPADNGYYRFSVYIADKSTQAPEAGSTVIPTHVHHATTANEQIVTDNTTEIEDFTVTGGYSDKFIITWKAVQGWTYTLSYTQSIDGTPDGITYVVNISTPGNVTDTNVDPRGVERTYTLSAKTNGAPISTTKEPVASLGEPSPTFDAESPKYDSISVTWKKLAAANSYTVKSGSSQAVNVVLPEDDPENANVTEKTDSMGQTFYTYTFDRTALGDYCTNATTSGTDIGITVSASSGKDNTSASVQARTLGPATVGLNSEVAKAESQITSTWKKVQGAKGYFIQRNRYRYENDKWVKESSTPEAFYLDAETLGIESNGESVPGYQMEVYYNGSQFRLIDKYVAIPEGAENIPQSQITQSRIPWGIPIEYTVFPVLSSADKLNKNGELQSKTLKGNLPYANIDSISKKGSTFGYGLNVRASKSESSQLVTVTWDLPYGNKTGASSLKPMVYRRIKGRSSEFTDTDITVKTITDPNAKTADAQCTTDETKTKPYEYVVKYLSTASDVNPKKPFVPEYVEFNKTVLDETYSPTEPANVGYTFNLPYFAAENVPSGANEGFSESVSWETWDYATRSIGPEDEGSTSAYTVWIKNKNNAAGWYQIASISQNGEISITSALDWYKTDVVAIPKGLKLTPKTDSNAELTDGSGCNNGLLKVQRDYRHYYMIRAQRKNSEGKTIYTYIGLDESKWAYRKISGEELSKAAMLTVADLVNTHVTGHGAGTGTLGSGTTEWQIGNASSIPRFGFGQNSLSQFKWYIKDYNQTYSELPGVKDSTPVQLQVPLKSFIKVSDENSSGTYRGKRESSTLHYLSAETNTNFWGRPDFGIDKRIPLIVEPYEIDGPCVSYGGTVNFAVSNNDIAITLERNGTTVFEKKITGNAEDRLKWCPMNLEDSGYKGKDSSSGWWPTNDIINSSTPDSSFVLEDE